MREVLVVAQSFPPVGGSHATRVSALVAELGGAVPTRGIGPRIGAGYPNRSTAASKVEVLRTYPGIAHAAAHGFPVDTARTSTLTTGRPLAWRVLQRIKKFAVNAYRRLEFIDSYMDWIPHLAIGVRREAKAGRSVVVSMSMPNSTHVATLLALTGLSNPWVADFADPWTLDRSRPRGGVRGRIERWLEAAVIRRASLLSFATQKTLDDYRVRYPKAARKMILARMGYDPADRNVPARVFEGKAVFYGGSLPAENRNASNLLATISLLTDVRFVFAGPCVGLVEKYFEGIVPANVVLIPWLDHAEFCAAVKGADASVVFGNSNPQQVPGKVYQYAGLARRVLYFPNMPTPEDESLTCLGSRAYVVPTTNSCNEIRAALAIPETSAGAAEYSWEVVLERLVREVAALAGASVGRQDPW